MHVSCLLRLAPTFSSINLWCTHIYVLTLIVGATLPQLFPQIAKCRQTFPLDQIPWTASAKWYTHVFSTDMKAAPPNLSKYTTLIFHTPHKREQLYTHHEALWRQEQTWFVSFGERESKSHVSSWESKPERDLLITSHKFLPLSLWTHSREQPG